MNKKTSNSLALLLAISLLAACSPSLPQFIEKTATPLDESARPTTDNLYTSTALQPEGNTTTSLVGIDALIALVNQYVGSGDITGNAENGLLAKLGTIKTKMMRGQQTAAGNELGAFINQVQAQQGKKISDLAANALIALAQQVTLDLSAVIPVTGVTMTPSATATQPAPPSTPQVLTLPTPLGEKQEHQASWNAVAAEVAKSVGFTIYTYDLYQLSAKSAWADTLAYYDAQAAANGWGDIHSLTTVIPGGNYAVWTMTFADGTRNTFVLVQMDSDQDSFTLNISGR